MEEKENRKTKKIKMGVVISDKMEKSIVVKVQTIAQHPLYKRTVKRSKKYIAHDEENTCKIGDEVKIIECRPLSRHKRWRLLEVINAGQPSVG